LAIVAATSAKDLDTVVGSTIKFATVAGFTSTTD